MTEIDFDELDKAVNNLMAQPASSNASGNNTEEANSNKRTTAGSEPIGESVPKTESAGSRNSEVNTSTPLAQRRGQFMDVMHPSAKMRIQQPQSPKPKVSHQGTSIDPGTTSQLSDKHDSKETSDSTSSDSAAHESVTNQSNTNLQSDLTLDNQPKTPSFDPIDFAMDNSEPLTSPFLADAKVEKRPLGGPVVKSGNALNLESLALDDTSQPTSPTEADTTPTTPLPAELSNDIMQIESKGADVPSELDSQALATKQTVAAVPAQTSIPQQYNAAKPKVPSAEPDSQAASMYDLGEVPLKVPNKKRSSWPIVIGAIVLIALGVVGSVGLFLLNHS